MCTFYLSNGFCAILKEQNCQGCKFKKTEAEFIKGKEAAKESLKNRGLEPHMIHTGECAYMTVRRIRDNEN